MIPAFCFFYSCVIVLLTPFTHKPDSSSNLTILMIYLIYSSETINIFMSDSYRKFYFKIFISFSFKLLLTNGACTFFINVKPTLMGQY